MIMGGAYETLHCLYSMQGLTDVLHGEIPSAGFALDQNHIK